MASPMKSDFLAGSHMKLPKIGIAAAVAVVASIVIYLALSNFFVGTDEFKNDENQSIKEYPDNTRFMRFTHGKQLSKAGEDLAGSEPYLIHNGKLKELVIFAPEHLQEFHRKDANSHYKPENMNMGDYAGQLLGQCVGQLGGTKWKLARSHMDPEFSYRASRSMMKRFSQEIDSWVRHLSENPTRRSTQKDVFVQDVKKRCKDLSLRSIAISIYGETFSEENYAILSTMNELHEKIIFVAFLNKRVMSKWYNKLPTAEKRLMDSFQTQWKAFNLAQIKLAREKKLSCPAEKIYVGVEAGDMSLPEFLQSLDEMLFTNIDITGSILALIFQHLAKDQAMQKKLRAEISAHRAQPGYTVGDYISKQNTLLHFSLLESIRVTPAMYFTLPECNASPKRIGGFHIPAHTPTIVDVNRLNKNESIWGTEADAFRPERFFGLDPARYRFGFVRWGIGRDKCLGKNMAEVILKLAILAVTDKYTLHVSPALPGQGEKSEAGFTINRDVEVEFRPAI
ncbi:cytochrome P450 monooxygenase [Aspergillus flavus]|nr:cytochrome P450 monooxygenase [Aspergillus flavus]